MRDRHGRTVSPAAAADFDRRALNRREPLDEAISGSRVTPN